MDCVALSSSDLCSSSSSGAAGGARVLVRVDQTYRDDEVQKDSQGNEGLTASALVTVVDLRQKMKVSLTILSLTAKMNAISCSMVM